MIVATAFGKVVPDTQASTTTIGTSTTLGRSTAATRSVDTCSDLAWADLDGDTCEVYTVKQWCKPDGSYGPGWGAIIAAITTFEAYAANGNCEPFRMCRSVSYV